MIKEILGYLDFSRSVKYIDENDQVQEAPISAIKDIPRVHKAPTLIKDIMPSMEQGDRTKEQMTLMKLNEFNRMHRPNPNVMGTSTMFMVSSASSMWPTNTLGGSFT